MILATALDIGIAGGGFALAYGGIELAKQVVKKRNGQSERRTSGFRDDDRLRLKQTQKTGEDCEDSIRDVGSTLKEMSRTLDMSLAAQKDLLVELRSWHER